MGGSYSSSSEPDVSQDIGSNESPEYLPGFICDDPSEYIGTLWDDPWGGDESPSSSFEPDVSQDDISDESPDYLPGFIGDDHSEYTIGTLWDDPWGGDESLSSFSEPDISQNDSSDESSSSSYDPDVSQDDSSAESSSSSSDPDVSQDDSSDEPSSELDVSPHDDSSDESPDYLPGFICDNPSEYIGSLWTDPWGGYKGECVSLIRVATGDHRPTREWKEGEPVWAYVERVKPGTAIATFHGGRFVSDEEHGDHAALFVQETSDGMIVIDQWAERKDRDGKILRPAHPAAERLIRWDGTGKGSRGSDFHIIK